MVSHFLDRTASFIILATVSGLIGDVDLSTVVFFTIMLTICLLTNASEE